MDSDFMSKLAAQSDAEQLGAAFQSLGKSVRQFYASLTNSGFSEQQALYLTAAMVKQMFANTQGQAEQ